MNSTKYMEWMKDKETEFKNSNPKQHFTSWMMEQFFQLEQINHKELYQGFALALTSLIKFHDLPTVARDIMKSNGISLVDLKKAKVEKYDLDIIKKALK